VGQRWTSRGAAGGPSQTLAQWAARARRPCSRPGARRRRSGRQRCSRWRSRAAARQRAPHRSDRHRPASRRHRRASPPDPARRGPGHGRPAAASTPPSAAQRPRQPSLIGDPGQQRAARVRHQPLSVRPRLYRETTPIACHPQGDPPKLGLQAFSNPKNPCSGGQSSGPDHRGRNCLMHDPGSACYLRPVSRSRSS
jgi:hypothetical protein